MIGICGECQARPIHQALPPLTHHENEFVRGKKHVNGIESFWSFCKLRIAKLRGVRKEKFHLHLMEFAWRFNHRKDNLTLLILKIATEIRPLLLRPSL